jgi:Na+/melibiose symporter-like transporter
MYGAAVPVAVLYFLLWNPPHWSSGALFAYLVVNAIFVRMAIACYEIPSTALAPELSTDYDQRTSLMAFRWLFGALGAGITLAVTFVFFMVATKAQPAGILNRDGYFAYSVMAAVIMMASILISAAGTHSRIKYMKKLPARPSPGLRKLAREMYESLSHRSLLMVTLASLFSGVALGLGSALNTYFGTYFWKFSPQQLSVIGFGFLLAAAIAVPLASAVSRRLDKRRGYVATAFASLFVNNIAMTMKYFGLLPPDGSFALLGIFFATITIGLALAIASGILISSMIADVVEDSEIKTGRRSEGLFSASLSFVNKATTGFGILLAGALIDLVHFPNHAAPSTIDIVAPHAVRNLVLVYMPVQIVLWIVSITLVSGYRIDRTTHTHNLKRLAEAAAFAETAPPGLVIAGGAGEVGFAEPADVHERSTA